MINAYYEVCDRDMAYISETPTYFPDEKPGITNPIHIQAEGKELKSLQEFFELGNCFAIATQKEDRMEILVYPNRVCEEHPIEEVEAWFDEVLKNPEVEDGFQWPIWTEAYVQYIPNGDNCEDYGN